MKQVWWQPRPTGRVVPAVGRVVDTPMTVYLESTDSVNVDYRDILAGDQESQRDAFYQGIQIFLEMVSAISLGRRVIVPQSVAFDSFAFQMAAARVWEAFDEARVTCPQPIALHLHGFTSYKDAVASMIARAGRGEFLSSAFPELRREWRCSSGNPGEDLLRKIPDEDPRKGLLEGTLKRFATTGANRLRRDAPRVTLGEQLSSALMAAAVAGGSQLSARVSSACDALQIAKCGFNARSPLRSQYDAWPWDRKKRTVGQIVDDPEVVDFLIEFVDTLYNKVVGYTTGAAIASFSTKAVSSTRQLNLLRAAQDAAVKAVEPVRIDEGTAFQFEVVGSAHLAEEELQSFIESVATAKELQTGLTELFRASADPDGGFRSSLNALDESRTEDERRERLAAHLDQVAHVLGHGYGVARSDLRWSEIAVGVSVVGEPLAASSAVLTLAAQVPSVPISMAAWIGLAGAAVSLPAVVGLPMHVRDWKRRTAQRRERAQVESISRRAIGHVLLES